MTAQDSRDRQGLGVGWYASAALVVAVIAALVWILLTRNNPDSTATAPITTSSTSSSTSSMPSSTPSTVASASVPSTTGATPSEPVGWPDTGCNGTTGSTGSPLEPLVRQVKWEPFLSAAIPVSAELGPKVVKSPLRQCFQHSPAGAVMAAVNISYALFTPGGARYVIDKQVIAGPGRDELLAAAKSASATPAPIVGYRLAGCGPAACNVQIAFFGQGMYGISLVPLVWHEGDWYMDGSRKFPESGPAAALPAGFTPWGAST